jgi:succinate dehydrogenase/fumarate reductase iron-sulfur protein
MADSATLRIRRFDPSTDPEPYYKEYEITGFDTESGPLTVLKALHWINLHIEPIAYDYNCRRTSCGLCGVMVDGEAKLGCMAPITMGKEVTVEPLLGFPIIRDLIVDTSIAHQRFLQTSVSIKTSGPDEVCRTNISAENWWNVTSHHVSCRECMLCYSSCQALQSFNRWDSFAGPGALQQIYLRHIDEIDESDRVKQAVDLGVFECVQCGMCTKVCPAHIPTCENNRRLMDEAEQSGLKPSDERTSYWPML